MQPPPVIPYDDDPGIAETFVDGPIGVNFINGNMHITFFTNRTDHRETPPAHVRRVSLRLVIPVGGAIDLQQTLGNLLQILRDQRTLQVMSPGSHTRQ